MMSWIIKFKWICILYFCLFFLFPVDVFAHKIYVFAWAEHGKIFTEAKFSSNKFVKNGKIIVKDDKGKILLSGTTSEIGEFSFKIPENLKSDLEIEVDAGMGHKGKWKIGIDEILESNTNKDTPKTNEKEKLPTIKNVIIGILIIFVFFLFIAFYNKKLLNKK